MKIDNLEYYQLSVARLVIIARLFLLYAAQLAHSMEPRSVQQAELIDVWYHGTSTMSESGNTGRRERCEPKLARVCN